jgi:hypothetical protein
MAAACAHDGFHSVTTRYDRARGLLVFVRTCDGCGGIISEVGREPYRPRFDPLGGGSVMRVSASSASGRAR